MIPERLPWHDPQWRRMERSIRSGRVPHALLLRGASGRGKAMFAGRLAALLLCGSDAAPCGECASCRLCAAGSHPDRIDVGLAPDRREIVVDQIRALIDSVSLTARFGRWKVVIVDPAGAMNRHAANTLLKTLEEPPGAAVFILVSSNHAQLFPTIRSRCQRIDFPVADRDIALKWLEHRVRERNNRLFDADGTQLREHERQRHVRCRPDTGTLHAVDRKGAEYIERTNRSAHGRLPDAVEALALACGAPIRAAELLEGDLLKARVALERDIDELLAEGDPMTVAARWKELGRETVTRWLVDILAQRLRRSVRSDAERGGRGGADLHFAPLLSMLDRCLEVRGGVLARSGANEQLALERLALGISLEAAGGGRRAVS